MAKFHNGHLDVFRIQQDIGSGKYCAYVSALFHEVVDIQTFNNVKMYTVANGNTVRRLVMFQIEVDGHRKDTSYVSAIVYINSNDRMHQFWVGHTISLQRKLPDVRNFEEL